jgi:hypothetical protein
LGLGRLNRPAGIAILLGELGRLALPVLRHAALLDRLLLGPGVALLGRRDDGRVNQLPGHGEVARATELLVEPLEQALDHAALGQGFTEGPDGVGIGDGVAQSKPQKPHPGQPVAQVNYGTLVTEVVLRLQDQDLEHQDMIERRRPALGPVGPRHGALEFGPEQLEVNHRGQPLEVVALLRQPAKRSSTSKNPARGPIPSSPVARHSRADQACLAQVFGDAVIGLSPWQADKLSGPTRWKG